MVTYSTIGVLGAGEVGRAVTGQAVRHYDDAGLLRRHDYAAEVLGRPPAAHFCE
ncbi:hypothetical protein [Streptomyces sasae]|uniref:hypothetical protein n=1 Tax=Streptomyces sasae TaxID=1266772 RepID=UPI002930745D|nr:hypothetical protein [Streptomyces sasae]